MGKISIQKLTAWFGVLLFSACPSFAQKKIVVIRSSNMDFYLQAQQGFQKKLDALGISYTIKDCVLPGESDKASSLFEGIKASNPDVVLTLGTSATKLAREKITNAPVVFCMVSDPKNSSLANPGVTLDVKPSHQIGYLAQNFPNFKKLGVLFNPSRSQGTLKELQQAAGQKGGLEIIPEPVSSAEQLEASIQSLATQKADILLMLSDPTIYTAQTAPQFILFTLRSSLPIVSFSPAYVKAGALTGIYADIEDNGAQAGEIVSRIFKGEKMESIPLYWPSKIKSAVNLVVANRLNITVSRSALQEAEQVIK